MFEKEFQYYLNNQNELVKKYRNQFIIIRGEQVVDAFDSEDEAYFKSEAKYGLGNFFLIKCEPGDDYYTQTYDSRVTFNDCVCDSRIL